MILPEPSSPSASASTSASARKRIGDGVGPSPSSKKLRSPFADFGSYMVEKNRKLRLQFDASSLPNRSGIFSGISIFVDGFTDPSSQELKAIMLKHGGRFENYFSKQRVTHIICSHLPDSKMRNFRAFSRGLPVVKPEWVVESLATNKLLSWLPYQITDSMKKAANQQKLSSFFIHSSISNKGDFVEAHAAPSSVVRESLVDEEQDDEMKVETSSSGRDDGQSVGESSKMIHSDSLHVANIPSAGTKATGGVLSKRTTTENEHPTLTSDPRFVEKYFKNSRLHFIGTWRNRYRDRFCSTVSKSDNRSKPNSVNAACKAIFIHIDMDCFFVSVVARNRPNLLDKPLAVCHSDNPKGTSEISSPNYHARYYGVKAGMFVRDAKVLCPQLTILPYDFEAYEEVADQFYSILHKHCNKVQAVSCDEAYLDVTQSGSGNPEELAQMIRKEIYDTTGCTASAGIGENLLLARLATRSAKPNGQHFIPTEEIDKFLEELPVNELPGVGHALQEKLNSKQIYACGQLRVVPKDVLHKDFGIKIGEMLWSYSRGIDNRSIEVVQETKSIGADVNWGVRFNDHQDCQLFLSALSNEVSLRLKGLGMRGRTITLKIKKRRKGAKEPAKYMGCGDCENMSHSMTLPAPTDDPLVLGRIAKQIFTSFHVDVKEIRGVGLHITRLESVSSSRQVQGDNTLQTWLASASEKSKGKGTSNLAFSVETEELYPAKSDASHADSCLPSGGERNLVFPPLDHINVEILKDLPQDILSEMDEMYDGKLADLMKNLNSGKDRMDDLPTTFSPKVDRNASSSCNMGFDSRKHFSMREQAQCRDTVSCSKYIHQRNFSCPAIMDNQAQSVQVETSTSRLNDPHLNMIVEANQMDSATSLIGADVSSSHLKAEEHRFSNSSLWAGAPPKWIEKFKNSCCLTLNVFAELYLEHADNNHLSSALQFLFSFLSKSPVLCEEPDDAFSSLCELLLQYITIKVDSDVEELYVCFRHLKRVAPVSTIFLRVYNHVLPFLQVAIRENYGGRFDLPMSLG